MGEKEGQDPLSEINWGEIREPYISDVSQKLAGQIGQMVGQPATSTGGLPFIAPMNPLQQNAPDLMNRMMGYGNFRQPKLQAFGQAGGITQSQPPIYEPPPTPPLPTQPGVPGSSIPIPPGPNQPAPGPFPGNQPQPLYPRPQPMPYPMNQPMPMPYPNFDPYRRQ